MEPGAFSVSLAVQDLEASRLFYEASFADVREVQKSLDRRGARLRRVRTRTVWGRRISFFPIRMAM